MGIRYSGEDGHDNTVVVALHYENLLWHLYVVLVVSLEGDFCLCLFGVCHRVRMLCAPKQHCHQTASNWSGWSGLFHATHPNSHILSLKRAPEFDRSFF
jgi:hypothetical protein